MDQVITKLLEYGLPGLILVCMGYYIWYQSKRIDKITDDRFEDSKDQLAAMTALQMAIKEMTSEIRQKLEVLKDAVKDMRSK